MIGRALVVWGALLACAIANGAFREAVLSPRFGSAAAHILSTLILSAVILLLAVTTITWIGPRTRGDAWAIGAIWVALVLAFEFLAGHYLFGNPWEQLLADYNVFEGRIWPLVPLVTILAPAVGFVAREPTLTNLP